MNLYGVVPFYTHTPPRGGIKDTVHGHPTLITIHHLVLDARRSRRSSSLASDELHESGGLTCSGAHAETSLCSLGFSGHPAGASFLPLYSLSVFFPHGFLVS